MHHPTLQVQCHPSLQDGLAHGEGSCTSITELVLLCEES